jgi:CheY-like chemotaxis protein
LGQAAKAGETVLVVEDEVLLRLSIAAYLRDCGYSVIEAADADEAVLVLKQPDLDIDVLFTDIEMPGAMDGFGLAQWTRANRRGLDVILTGTAPRAVNAAANLCEDGPVPDRIRRLLAARPPRRPAGRPKKP